jgi:hypothetical protein
MKNLPSLNLRIIFFVTAFADTVIQFITETPITAFRALRGFFKFSVTLRASRHPFGAGNAPKFAPILVPYGLFAFFKDTTALNTLIHFFRPLIGLFRFNANIALHASLRALNSNVTPL